MEKTAENKTIRLGNVYGEQFGQSFGGNVWGGQGLSPTLKTTAAASQQCVVEIIYLGKKEDLECQKLLHQQ